MKHRDEDGAWPVGRAVQPQANRPLTLSILQPFTTRRRAFTAKANPSSTGTV